MSPNPLQELLHQRVTRGRLVAKPLVTGGNGCCIQLNCGSPANTAVLKEKLTRLRMPGGSDSFPCTNANPNQITLKQAVADPVQAVWMVCTTRIESQACLNLSLTGARRGEAGQRWATCLLLGLALFEFIPNKLDTCTCPLV